MSPKAYMSSRGITSRYRVGDPVNAARRQQAEVPNVLHVVRVGLRSLVLAAKHRLDHPLHALLSELVRKLVQVCLTPDHELLPCLHDGVFVDRERAVPASLVPEARLVGQGVDQPRLALGLVPHRSKRGFGESLARLLGVLAEQGARCGLVEVAEPQRFRLDVEGAAAGDDLAGGLRVDAVVAHVADAAQDHALRKGRWAHVVAGAQLAQHRDQRVAHERIDLVDQEHEGLGVVLGPVAECPAKGTVGPGAFERLLPRLVEEAVTQGEERTVGDLRQHSPNPGCDIAPRSLP